jgi:hypothetical protein
MGYAERTVSPSYVGERVSRNRCTMSGRRSSWKPASGGWRVAGGTSRAATTDEVKDLRRDAVALKEVVAEQTLELRLLKKSMIGDGGDEA